MNHRKKAEEQPNYNFLQFNYRDQNLTTIYYAKILLRYFKNHDWEVEWRHLNNEQENSTTLLKKIIYISKWNQLETENSKNVSTEVENNLEVLAKEARNHIIKANEGEFYVQADQPFQGEIVTETVLTSISCVLDKMKFCLIGNNSSTPEKLMDGFDIKKAYYKLMKFRIFNINGIILFSAYRSYKIKK